jgi:membrane protease subunit HflC
MNYTWTDLNNYFSNRVFAAVAASCFFLLVLYGTFFTIGENQQCFVIRFGKIVDKLTSPGVHAKLPFIDEVNIFDKRVLHISLPTKEVLASDQKRFIIDAYVKYVIVNADIFFATLRSERNAESRIGSIFESSLRQTIGKYKLTDLLSLERFQIMQSIQSEIKDKTKEFGIDIIDVRIIKADLPGANLDAVFNRMQTERQQEAKELRSEGKEESISIIAKADKESKILKSKAELQAKDIIGNAEAQAMKIYNSSFSKDREFYEFYRTIRAYNKINSAESKFKIFISPEEFNFLKAIKNG